MSTIDDIVLQMKILTNKITVFRSTITTDMTTESQARINYDEYLRDLVQGLQDQISSIDITNNTAGILDVINAVSTAIDSHQLVLSPQTTIRAIKRIAPLNGGTVNVTEDANNIFIHGEGNGISRQRIVRYTASATLKLSDANCIIECDSTDLIVLTVPAYDDVPFKSAVLFDIVQINTGGVSVVAAAGVTVEASGDGLDGIDTSGLLYLSQELNRFIFSIAGGSGIPDGGTTSQALLKQSNDDGDATWQTLTKDLVGLSAVDNTSDVNKPVSTAQAVADTAILNSAKTYADNLVVGLFDFRGNYDASTNTFPTTGGSGIAGVVLKGDIWRVSVAGTLGGVAVRVGDSIYAAVDTPAQTSANWGTILLELGYNPLSDVTNGTAVAGAIPLVGGSGTARTVARIKPTNTDMTVTAGATIADPVSIGLNGTTLKHWEEESQAISAATQRLIWKPKHPNAAYVLANTVEVIAVKQGLTTRDPSDPNFPTGFRSGLDIQMTGESGTSATFAAGGYAFGEANTVGSRGVGVGIGNTVGAADFGAQSGVAFGRGNSVGVGGVIPPFGSAGVALGVSNSAGINSVAVGRSNSVGGSGVGIGGAINASDSTMGFGRAITLTGLSCLGVGSNITATSAARGIYIGGLLNGTAATGAIIVANPSVSAANDQGISGYHQFGRTASRVLGSQNNISDWTNTAWRDVPKGSLDYSGGASVGGSGLYRARANFVFAWGEDTANGAHTPVLSPLRKGVIRIEAWTIVGQTALILDGGDSDLLTYFDFRIVPFGGSGYKLQWAIKTDPTGGTSAANRHAANFLGELETKSTLA